MRHFLNTFITFKAILFEYEVENNQGEAYLR